MKPALRTLACVALGAVAACSGGSGHAKAAKPRAEPLTVRAGVVRVDSAGAPTTLPDATRDQVVTTVRTYVDGASVRPIRTGKLDGTIAGIFTPVAAARALGVDRAVLTDVGLPTSTGQPKTIVSPVALTALADTNGTITLVAASTSVTIGTHTGAGQLGVRRLATFVLAPDSGTWKIEGYDVGVVRKGAATGSGTATG